MQHNVGVIENETTSRNENMSQVSLTKGYWFYFDHEGNDISMFGSTWNGKEIVYFNNKPVSSFRNLNKLKSEHAFTANGHQYLVKTEMTSILRGSLTVEVYCDGTLIETDSVSQLEKGFWYKSFFEVKFLVFLGVCFCAGAAVGYFDLINKLFG